VQEVLVVAFHALNGRVDQVQIVAAEGAGGVPDAVDGELAGGGFAHDATFADMLAAGFKLRLDQDDSLP
jgi:hypothetical protein